MVDSREPGVPHDDDPLLPFEDEKTIKRFFSSNNQDKVLISFFGIWKDV